jgi:serine/threonine protein kinase
LILIILTSITILSLVFLLVIFLRRRYFYSSGKSFKRNQPPQYYQDVWCELGKKWQINPKYLTLAEKIGQGCFGDVYRGELKQNDTKSIEVAIKVLRDQNVASMHEFLFEANRMKDFSHSNVLSLIGVAWDPIRKAMVLLPFMKNGDLRSYISNEKNRPTVRQLITWGIEIADGMEYLSSLKFVHRDLATRNCMLDENLICRISDFGLSRDMIDRDYYLVPRTTITKEKGGQVIQIPPRRLPIRWLSPESIESSKYTIQSDVVSRNLIKI